MTKKYCFNMELYPLHIVLQHILTHVDKWARIRDNEIQYSVRVPKNRGKWHKKTLSLAEAQRIVGDLYV